MRFRFIGNPVGQFAFIPEQNISSIPWRDEEFENKLKIYSYGIFERESYRVACTVRHQSGSKYPLNVFIQYYKCSMDNCLSDLISKTCKKSTNQYLLTAKPNRINKYQTQFISSYSHTLNDPSTGHQYLCCYKQNGLATVAKAISILSRMNI